VAPMGIWSSGRGRRVSLASYQSPGSGPRGYRISRTPVRVVSSNTENIMSIHRERISANRSSNMAPKRSEVASSGAVSGAHKLSSQSGTASRPRCGTT
jgi:hypothetical protein